MRRAAATVAVALAVLGAGTARGMAGTPGAGAPAVSIGFDAYAPARTDVLTGDTVSWTNDSVRVHTVTATDGAWDSAQLAAGDRFSHRFAATGAYTYYCRLHPFMRGEVDVHDTLLDVPAQSAAPGRRYALSGRTDAGAGASVAIEGDSGAGFAPVAAATAGAGGAFHVSVTPRTTTSYRAVVAGREPSPPVRLVVVDHTVSIVRAGTRGARATVAVRVSPPAPRATVVLQLRLRERFGWWPVRRARLGAASTARFRLPAGRPVRARVLLTLADGATALARSRVFRLGAAAPAD